MEVRLLTLADFGWRWRCAFVAERLDVWRAVGGNRQRLFRFSTASVGVPIERHPWVAWADVIHIHWVQQGFLSLDSLGRLLRMEGKRFVWSLHDFWPLTGGCHIPYQLDDEGETTFCTAFKSHCGRCPLLTSGQEKDRAYRIFERKSKLPLAQIHFLAVSSEVARVAREAVLTRGSKVTVVHNPLDLHLFKPAERERRQLFDLLYVAPQVDDPIKGVDLLRKVLEIAAEQSDDFRQNGRLCVVGKVKDQRLLGDFPIEIQTLGHVDQGQLIELYQRASLYLSTSRYETMGQTILESIACGTPALAFRVGGISDLIKEGVSGSLVPPYEVQAMADQLLEWTSGRSSLDRYEVSETVSAFAQERIASQLLQIYREVE